MFGCVNGTLGSGTETYSHSPLCFPGLCSVLWNSPFLCEERQASLHLSLGKHSELLKLYGPSCSAIQMQQLASRLRSTWWDILSLELSEAHRLLASLCFLPGLLTIELCSLLLLHHSWMSMHSLLEKEHLWMGRLVSGVTHWCMHAQAVHATESGSVYSPGDNLTRLHPYQLS